MEISRYCYFHMINILQYLDMENKIIFGKFSIGIGNFFHEMSDVLLCELKTWLLVIVMHVAVTSNKWFATIDYWSDSDSSMVMLILITMTMLTIILKK